MPPTEPTLEELIQKAIDALVELINKRLKNKQLRDAQKLHSQAKVVTGYGTLSDTNPSDAAIDAWSDAECDAFANACKARSESLKEPEQPGEPS